MPRISQECILAQWEAAMREPLEVVAAETLEILTQENPELLEFINESIAAIFECQMMPAPLDRVLKRMMIGHTGIVYRIIRAQMDAETLNKVWTIFPLQSEEVDTDKNGTNLPTENTSPTTETPTNSIAKPENIDPTENNNG